MLNSLTQVSLKKIKHKLSVISNTFWKYIISPPVWNTTSQQLITCLNEINYLSDRFKLNTHFFNYTTPHPTMHCCSNQLWYTMYTQNKIFLLYLYTLLQDYSIQLNTSNHLLYYSKMHRIRTYDNFRNEMVSTNKSTMWMSQKWNYGWFSDLHYSMKWLGMYVVVLMIRDMKMFMND